MIRLILVFTDVHMIFVLEETHCLWWCLDIQQLNKCFKNNYK